MKTIAVIGAAASLLISTPLVAQDTTKDKSERTTFLERNWTIVLAVVIVGLIVLSTANSGSNTPASP